MIDFYKYPAGSTVSGHCCDSCVRRAGIIPKYPADSHNSSYLCIVCGHYNIGSTMKCRVGDWLKITPVEVA